MSKSQITAPLIPPACNGTGCAYCPTIKILLDDQRALQGQLKAAHYRYCHDSLVLRDTINYCRTLQDQVANLQRNCCQRNDALEEMRAQQTEHHRSLMMEQQKRALAERNSMTLHLENQALRKLFTPESEFPTVQQLIYTRYQNQQKTLENMNAKTEEYETGVPGSECSEDGGSDGEGTVIINRDVDEENDVY